MQEPSRVQVQPVLDTVKQLTAIESDSRDLGGLAQIAGVIAGRLSVAGMQVQTIPRGRRSSIRN